MFERKLYLSWYLWMVIICNVAASTTSLRKDHLGRLNMPVGYSEYYNDLDLFDVNKVNKMLDLLNKKTQEQKDVRTGRKKKNNRAVNDYGISGTGNNHEYYNDLELFNSKKVDDDLRKIRYQTMKENAKRFYNKNKDKNATNDNIDDDSFDNQQDPYLLIQEVENSYSDIKSQLKEMLNQYLLPICELVLNRKEYRNVNSEFDKILERIEKGDPEVYDVMLKIEGNKHEEISSDLRDTLKQAYIKLFNIKVGNYQNEVLDMQNLLICDTDLAKIDLYFTEYNNLSLLVNSGTNTDNSKSDEVTRKIKSYNSQLNIILSNLKKRYSSYYDSKKLIERLNNEFIRLGFALGYEFHNTGFGALKYITARYSSLLTSLSQYYTAITSGADSFIEKQLNLNGVDYHRLKDTNGNDNPKIKSLYEEMRKLYQINIDRLSKYDSLLNVNNLNAIKSNYTKLLQSFGEKIANHNLINKCINVNDIQKCVEFCLSSDNIILQINEFHERRKKLMDGILNVNYMLREKNDNIHSRSSDLDKTLDEQEDEDWMLLLTSITNNDTSKPSKLNDSNNDYLLSHVNTISHQIEWLKELEYLLSVCDMVKPYYEHFSSAYLKVKKIIGGELTNFVMPDMRQLKNVHTVMTKKLFTLLDDVEQVLLNGSKYKVLNKKDLIKDSISEVKDIMATVHNKFMWLILKLLDEYYTKHEHIVVNSDNSQFELPLFILQPRTYWFNKIQAKVDKQQRQLNTRRKAVLHSNAVKNKNKFKQLQLDQLALDEQRMNIQDTVDKQDRNAINLRITWEELLTLGENKKMLLQEIAKCLGIEVEDDMSEIELIHNIVPVFNGKQRVMRRFFPKLFKEINDKLVEVNNIANRYTTVRNKCYSLLENIQRESMRSLNKNWQDYCVKNEIDGIDDIQTNPRIFIRLKNICCFESDVQLQEKIRTFLQTKYYIFAYFNTSTINFVGTGLHNLDHLG